jgi:hypothetical protein
MRVDFLWPRTSQKRSNRSASEPFSRTCIRTGSAKNDSSCDQSLLTIAHYTSVYFYTPLWLSWLGPACRVTSLIRRVRGEMLTDTVAAALLLARPAFAIYTKWGICHFDLQRLLISPEPR